MSRVCSVRMILLLLFCGAGLWAQIRSGTIVGLVTDTSNAAIPGAAVEVTETATNAVYRVETNAAGQYTVPYLPAGRYSVKVEAKGFRTFTLTNLELSTAGTLRADARLEIGAVETTVTVESRAQALQTESATVQNAAGEVVIQALPNPNNNPFYYASLQQGVVPRAKFNDTQDVNAFGIGSDGRRNFTALSINGGQAFSNDIQLDGVSIQASAWNEAAILPNTDGLQEVRTSTNNYSAEYGRSQGVIIMTTKSGTNQYRGSGQYRLRNEALNANTFENNTRELARRPFKVNQFGGTFGGPVWLPRLYNGKDHTFFFVSYEGLRFNEGLQYLRTVPTPLERTGNFSQTRISAAGQIVPVQIHDPFSAVAIGANQYRRTPFPNSIIPASRLFTPAANALKEYPAPNRTPDDLTGINNFFNSMTRTYEKNNVNTRVDQRVGAHSIYGTAGTNYGTINSPNGWGSGTRAFTQSGFVGRVRGDRNIYASVGDVWAISPSLVADFRVGLTRVRAQNAAEVFPNFDYKTYGIPDEFQVANAAPGFYPNIGEGFTNWSALNGTAYLAKFEKQTNWNLVGSVTKTRGRWTHRIGTEYRVYLSNYLDARGSFDIRTNAAYTSGQVITADGGNVTNDPLLSGHGGASFLLGAGYIDAGENGVPLALAAKYWAIYSQNDWRATSRLTLNLGLRYEIQPAPTERYNRMSSFNYNGSTRGTPGAFFFPGATSGDRNLYRTQYGDWGPRLGLAYRVTQTFVVRSGFGVTYLPTNTGYFGGPYYYGAQYYFPRAISQPYGTRPAGVLAGHWAQVSSVPPQANNDASAPIYYGDNSNQPRFDYSGTRNGKSLQWNFFTEKRLGQNYIVSVGYAGTRSYHLPFARLPLNSVQFLPDSLLNEWRQSYIASNGTDPGVQRIPNPFQPNPAALIPYQGNLGQATMPRRETLYIFPYFTNLPIGKTEGYANYHSLQTQVTRRFSAGLTFNANYTWSKAMDYYQSEAQTNGYADSVGYIMGDQDRRNSRNTYALSGQDIPHRLVVSGVYDLPWGKGKRFAFGSPALNLIAGGWQLGGAFTTQSGTPIQIGGGNTNAINGRSNRLSGVPVELPKELQKWYDSPDAAGRTVTLPGGRTVVVNRFTYLRYNPDAFRGNVARLANGNLANDVYWWGTLASRYGDIRTAGRTNFNLSLQKQFRIGERMETAFSAECTNLLNSVQIRPEAYTTSLGAVIAQPSAAQAAQGVQPGMVANQNFGSNGLRTFDPRQVELRLRIRF